LGAVDFNTKLRKISYGRDLAEIIDLEPFKFNVKLWEGNQSEEH
jgi:hypothetical protein